jgi:hypothetical protein
MTGPVDPNAFSSPRRDAVGSFMAKCARDDCEPEAIDEDGKPLADAANTSFMKKCQSEA